MVKIFLILLVVLSVSACEFNNQDARLEEGSKTLGKPSAICLDGIQYWSNAGQLAVRIEAESLQPKKCIN
jgi:hypothetical protein